jgi:hypothetical protein
MTYFLTDEQEKVLDIFLNEQNREVCEKQLSTLDLPDNIKEIMEKSLTTNCPLPFYDTKYGFYSVSFTPCDYGVRIYAHHHITDVSKKIYDPSLDDQKNTEITLNIENK